MVHCKTTICKNLMLAKILIFFSSLFITLFIRFFRRKCIKSIMEKKNHSFSILLWNTYLVYILVEIHNLLVCIIYYIFSSCYIRIIIINRDITFKFFQIIFSIAYESIMSCKNILH